MTRKLKSILNKYNSMPLTLKAAIWFFVCTFLQKGISVITTPIFTRLLSTEEYGIYSIYISWADILSIFITFGLSSSVFQKKLVQLDNEQKKNELTSSFQGLATVTAAISFLIYWIFRSWFNSFLGLTTNLVISIYLSSLFTTAFGFWSMRQRDDYQYKPLVKMTIFTSVCKPVLGILAIHAFPEYKVNARIYTLVAVEIIAYIGIYIKQFADGKKFYIWDYWKYAIKFVLPLIPHFISQRILSQSDRLMINNMIGASEAGIYSLAHSVGWLMTMVITALDYTLAPWTYQKLRDKNIARLREFSVFPMIFMGIACLAFVTYTPEIIRVFASFQYHDAIWIVPPLVLSTYFMLLYTMFIYLEYYFEKTKQIMVATIASAILNIILNYIFIGLFGYFAAAYTSLICYFLYAVFHFFVFRKVCIEQFGEVVYDMKKITLISLLFVIATFTIMLLYDYLFIRIAITICILFFVMKHRKKIISELQLSRLDKSDIINRHQ